MREAEGDDANSGKGGEEGEGGREAHRLAALGMVAATLAHEYHNLLTPLIGHAELALAHADDPKRMRRAVERALEAAERADRISTAVLDLARHSPSTSPTTAPLTTPTRSRLDSDCRVEAVVLEVLEEFAERAGHAGVAFRTELDPEAAVGMAASALRQVLVNLLRNALRAVQLGGGAGGAGGWVLVQANPQRDPKSETQSGSVVIRIRDNGPGVPAAIRERMFEPFVTAPSTRRVEASTASKMRHQGTGLGLAVSRELVRQAGGELRYDREAGGITAFTIELPAVAAAVVADAA